MLTLPCLLLITLLTPPSKSPTPIPPAPAKKPEAKPVTAGVAPDPVNTPLPKTRTAPVWSVAFSPDGKTLAVGGYRAVRLYETETGKKTAEFPVEGEAVRSICFAKDGKTLAVGTGIPGYNGVASVIDSATGKTVAAERGHDDTVEAVAFYNTSLLSAADDETILVTDTANGQKIGKLTEHNGRCLSVAVPLTFNEDMGGEIFATGGADNMFKVWDAKARRVVVNFDQCASPVWAVAPRPPHAGRFVTGSGDGRLRYFVVYRDKNGKPDEQGVWPRGGYQEAQFDAHEGGVYAVAVAPTDGFVVTGGADKNTVIWNTGGGKRKTFGEAEADIWGVAVSPDSKKVAAASFDGKTRIYDVEKQRLLLTLDANGVYTPPVPKLSGPLFARLPNAFAAGSGLTGSYYNNREGTGRPALVRTDAGIDFNWDATPPADGVNRDQLFVRWEGVVEAPLSGDYRFWTQSDDGVRLWIGGKLVVDSWVDRGATDDQTEPISLKAGQRLPIKMEYYQGSGGASVRLHWEYTGTRYIESVPQNVQQTRQPVPKAYLYPISPTNSGK